MPALSALHLRKSFGSQVVLEDASLSLARGEKVGLIGANGGGKSTLAKILAGVETADGGTVSVRRGLSVRYLAQEPELDPTRSAREAVEDALTAWRAAVDRHAHVSALLGEPDADHDTLLAEQAELGDSILRLGGWERGHEALGFLERLGVREVDRPCGERSGGERRRIALAQLLVASPDVAILDEPTNHLDADTAAWLEGYLASDFAGATLLVTHDRYFLDAAVERIVEIERGRLTSYPGSFGVYLEKKAEALAHEERVERNQQNILRREREWLSRGPKARSTKQKARIQRAAVLESQVAAGSVGRTPDVSLVTAAAAREGKTILELHGVQVSPVAGGAPLNAPFDLILSSGDRIGIVGPNGAGKSTLVRAILGEPLVVGGAIVRGKNLKTAYLDQARAGLDDAASVFDDVRGEGGANVVNLGVRGRETMELRSYLELFGFDGSKQRQKVGSLSGGERARVALAKVLREGANLLVFDEPTNDLDLPTLTALEDLLVDFEGSVLVVTHDRAFLDQVATAILAFDVRPGGAATTVTRYAGGYQDYLAQRGERRSVAPPAPPPAPKPAAAAPAPAPARSRGRGGLTHAERLELEAIVDRVEKAERQVTEIEAKLADPTLYAQRRGEVAGLQAELTRARHDAATLVARWEDLEARKNA